MATLQFDGVDDNLQGTGIGGGTGAFTYAVLFKRAATKIHGLLEFFDSGTSIRHGLQVVEATNSLAAFGQISPGAFNNWPAPALTLNTTDWYLCASTKAAGAVTPRLHLKNITAGTAWQHADAAGELMDPPSTAGGTVRVGHGAFGSQRAQGDIGVAAFWDGTALTDPQVETLAANCSLAGWHALAPSSLTPLDTLTPTDHEGLVTWTVNGATLVGDDPSGCFDAVEPGGQLFPYGGLRRTDLTG